MVRYHHLPIFQKSYDFLIRLQKYVDRMPRFYRYTHGEKLINLSLEFLYLIIQANSVSKKYPILLRADQELEKIRIHCRLMRDLNSFNAHQYEVLSRELEDIGRQVGGWLKSEFSREKTLIR